MLNRARGTEDLHVYENNPVIYINCTSYVDRYTSSSSTESLLKALQKKKNVSDWPREVDSRWRSLSGPSVPVTGHLQAVTGFVCSSLSHRGTTLLPPSTPEDTLSTVCPAHIQTISSPLVKGPACLIVHCTGDSGKGC